MEQIYYEIKVIDKEVFEDPIGHQKYLEELCNNPGITKVDRCIYRCNDLDTAMKSIPHHNQWVRWHVYIFEVRESVKSGKINKDKKIIHSIGYENQSTKHPPYAETGAYTEMCIYDTKDFYKKKDPESKKLIQLLENDPNIYKVAPGVYRGSGLHSFARIHQTSRWRMEVSEKYNGRNVKIVQAKRHMFEDWDTRFSKPGNRSIWTFFTDYFKTFTWSGTLYVIFSALLTGLCIFVSKLNSGYGPLDPLRPSVFEDFAVGFGILIAFIMDFFVLSFFIISPFLGLFYAYKDKTEYDPE